MRSCIVRLDQSGWREKFGGLRGSRLGVIEGSSNSNNRHSCREKAQVRSERVIGYFAHVEINNTVFFVDINGL